MKTATLTEVVAEPSKRSIAVETGPEFSGHRRPRIITALGKQGAGKSLLLRFLVEWIEGNGGRPLKLLDADPHNETLKKHFPKADTPGSSGLDDRRVSLEGAVRAQREAAQGGSPYDAVWDIGGGDLLMERLAKQARFAETVDRLGIDLTVFYTLSPSLSDLDYFQRLEDAGFKPRNLALMFNIGKIQGDRTPERAFDAVLETPLVQTLVGRGVKWLFMPALPSDCMEAVEKTGSGTFRDAMPQLDVFHAIYLETWLSDMEKQIAKPLIEWGWIS